MLDVDTLTVAGTWRLFRLNSGPRVQQIFGAVLIIAPYCIPGNNFYTRRKNLIGSEENSKHAALNERLLESKAFAKMPVRKFFDQRNSFYERYKRTKKRKKRSEGERRKEMK